MQQVFPNCSHLVFSFKFPQCLKSRKRYNSLECYIEALHLSKFDHCSTRFSSLYLNIQTAIIFSNPWLFFESLKVPKTSKLLHFLWVINRTFTGQQYRANWFEILENRIKNSKNKLGFLCWFIRFIASVLQCRKFCRISSLIFFYTGLLMSSNIKLMNRDLKFKLSCCNLYPTF